jgi:gliding motility-associated-like protein
LIKKSYIAFLVCLWSWCGFSQTTEDLKKTYTKRTVQQPTNIQTSLQQRNTFEYRFCDADGDGFALIDLIPIRDAVQAAVISDLATEPPRIIAGTASGSILEINDFLNNPTVTELCLTSEASTDVAVNSSEEIFNTDGDQIVQIDRNTCAENQIIDVGGTALSFDTQNNLYFNDPSQSLSQVFRFDAGFGSPPYVWHDFLEGLPGGDFVINGNFMYISWVRPDGAYVLFRVTIDSDFNYISHEEIGEIREETFGLASEQGVLYGITGSEIYRINLTTPISLETVYLNDFAFGTWFGAAGVSEAIAFESSAHVTEDQANNDTDPLPDSWTNTVSGGQTIYVRVEEITTGNFIVTPVTIGIDPTPIIANTPANLESCDNDNNGTESFDFTLQTIAILGTQDDSLFEVIYSTDVDFTTTITTPTNYAATQPLETIYFRIVNTSNTACFSSGSFTLTVNPSNACPQNLPPELSVSGRFPYCPQTDIFIAENFNITDPDDNGIESFSVQISSGYQINVDRLLLSGSHPTINATWDANQGILTLTAVGGGEILYTNLIPAVRDIVYQSLNTSATGEKFFSFNIGDANYLPSTDHYYEYVEANLIDWESARQAAENRTYFGLQGYLATVTTPDEAQLTGEQAAGTGWIGGSDAAQEGVWRWVTGPEAGTIFWNGGPGGSTPNFAFWNTGEPNNAGDEDYAHVTDPSVGILGSWNDLPLVGGNGPFVPRGYVVEYGGMPGDPLLNISGSTSIFIPEITSVTADSTCAGETATLEATVTEGDIFWYDAPTGGTLLATGNTFVTPPITANTIFYAAPAPEGCVTITRTPVQVSLSVSPTVNNAELEACSLNEDGFATFDLTLANPLISANFATETFQYYPTENDAENQTNEIMNPTAFTNVNENNDSVWVRTTTVDGCFAISRLDLEVSSTVIPTSFSQTYETCDDFLDINGNNSATNNDQDGIATFDFSDVTNDIINLFPASQAANISVSYYESEADANNAVNPITDISNHRNSNSPNTQQIFVRVENADNNTCIYVGTHITLNVLPVPISNPVPDLDICDNDADGDDTNGFVQNIDLESQTADILGTQDPSLYTVTYHETSADAMSGSNPIVSPYTNTSLSQTIYVRVVEDAVGCVTARNSFNINIRPLPTVNAVAELRQCDDNTDGFSVFNLNEAASDISLNFMNETFEFFETETDAENGVNQITNATAYTNQVQSSDVVWARAISSFGCFRIAQVNLTVATSNANVTTFTPRTFTACDDFLDVNGDNNANNDDTDGISSFNFDITADLLNQFPVNEQPNLVINYYRTQADALSELNAIQDPSNYRNIGFPNTQQIFVRVDNVNNNDCIGFAPLITLIVDPVPVSNPVNDLEACDNSDDGDFSNGFIQNFNLETQTPLILGTQDPAIYRVTYHLTANDANTGANAISNTTSYTNITANRQTIYVRVEHATLGCFVDRGTFDLVVNPLPTANFVPDLEVCDAGAPGTTIDGVTDGIDLEVQTLGILGSQDPNQFTVTYHRFLSDAQSGLNPIVGLYTNETPFTQTIYIRIVNDVTGCVNSISNFNLIVHPQPTVVDIVELPYCDDDLDGDDTNGFVQNIDLDSQIPLILGPNQDEDDYTVTFHQDAADAASGSNALSSPYSNTTADSQTIYVRVVNDDTGCVNSNFSFNVIIHPLPEFDVTSPQTVCVNDPDLTLEVENPTGIYDYVWTDPEGNETVGSQITATVGGIYLVTGTATDGTGCQRTREVEVIESIIANINDQQIDIIDDSENNSITIDPTNLGIGDYEYALTDENGIVIAGYQDDPTFENLEGGFYTVLVRDKNGCGVASLDVPVIEFPKFFTPNNDGINDTWAIKGVSSTFFPEFEVNIFNRFGKVVAQISIDNPGWDGNFNGKTLPSDDYWFSVRLVDRNGVVRERKGNMSLLRR